MTRLERHVLDGLPARQGMCARDVAMRLGVRVWQARELLEDLWTRGLVVRTVGLEHNEHDSVARWSPVTIDDEQVGIGKYRAATPARDAVAA